jgi:hypothetical protein
MSPFPVCLPAVLASQKTIVLFINVPGYKVSYVLFGNRREERVTDRAARERSRYRHNVKCCEYLLELLSDIVTLYEDMVRGERPGNKTSVPGEDHPVLGQRDADDLVIGHGTVIEDIESQKPHPLCKATEHDISDEFHTLNKTHSLPRSHEELRTINKKIKKMGTFSHHEGTKSRRTKYEL